MNDNLFEYYVYDNIPYITCQISGVFGILVRRGRLAVGVEGVGRDGGGWAPFPEKKIFLFPK